MIYLQLFFAYLQIGLFTIGGGHAAIPVAQSVLVDGYGWLTVKEFTDMITLSEMTPGPFAINSATYVGIKTGGILGGVVATLSFLIPSVVICFSLYFIVKKFRRQKFISGFMAGIKPAVSGLISAAGFTIALTALFGASALNQLKVDFNFDLIALIIATLSVIAVRKTKINPVLVILLSGVFGVLLYSAF